jgi:2-keto-4-pentenoate hydratase/2-oxohepta-3-ene-1,7-dioic acid hydratase in catechol pathway
VIALAWESSQVGWKAELAVVLGRAGRNAAAAQALDLVAVQATGTDVTARPAGYGISGHMGAASAGNLVLRPAGRHVLGLNRCLGVIW